MHRRKKLGMHRMGSKWSGKKMLKTVAGHCLGMILESFPSLVSEKAGGRGHLLKRKVGKC